MNVENKIINKLTELGYTCEYIEEGWYLNDEKVPEEYWENHEEPQEDFVYNWEEYFCKNKEDTIHFTWSIRDKEFIIRSIWSYVGSKKGEATKVLREVLKIIPKDWTISIDYDINREYWAHIENTDDHKFTYIYESLINSRSDSIFDYWAF